MNKKIITINEAARILGVSLDTLRRWDRSGKLKAVRLTPTGHRKYYLDEIEIFVSDIFAVAKKWASDNKSKNPADEFYCSDKSVFELRVNRLFVNLQKNQISDENCSLIISLVGEIGNNSFDHNVGSWPDIRGIFFAYDLNKRRIALVDRGRGILATLRKVKPELSRENEALRVAFTEKISGRSPESRGNGLKYVRKVITELSENIKISMYFQSGDSALNMHCGDKELKIIEPEISFRGCLALITF